MIENILEDEENVFIKAFLTLKDLAYQPENLDNPDTFVKYNNKGTKDESFVYYDEYNNDVQVYSRKSPDKMLKISGFDWSEERLNEDEEGYSSGVDIQFEVNYSNELAHMIEYIKLSGFWKEFEEKYISKYLSNSSVVIGQL